MSDNKPSIREATQVFLDAKIDEWYNKELGKDISNFISSHISTMLESLEKEIEERKDKMIENQMIKMGDLSFGSYNPTQIYNKGLDFVKQLIAKYRI